MIFFNPYSYEEKEPKKEIILTEYVANIPYFETSCNNSISLLGISYQGKMLFKKVVINNSINQIIEEQCLKDGKYVIYITDILHNSSQELAFCLDTCKPSYLIDHTRKYFTVNDENFSYMCIKQYTHDRKHLIREYTNKTKQLLLADGVNKITVYDHAGNRTFKEVETFDIQPYQFQEGELNLLANLIHREMCVNTLVNIGHPKDEAQRASMATGYCLINKALNNHGGFGETITAQLNSGQYGSGGSSALSGPPKCKSCYEIALKCYKYDCNSIYVVNTDGSISNMTHDVSCQSGWCVHVGKDLEGSCWWHFDTDMDGIVDNEGLSQDGKWDEFFEKCQCCTEHWHIK